jgi:hypothetical protein
VNVEEMAICEVYLMVACMMGDPVHDEMPYKYIATTGMCDSVFLVKPANGEVDHIRIYQHETDSELMEMLHIHIVGIRA